MFYLSQNPIIFVRCFYNFYVSFIFLYFIKTVNFLQENSAKYCKVLYSLTVTNINDLLFH